MKFPLTVLVAAIVALGFAAPAIAQTGQGQAVVTVLPKHDGETPANVLQPDMSVKINGKQSKVAKWTPYQGAASSVELVVLVDGSARSSLGRQLQDIAEFIGALPPNTKASIAYMQNGAAVFSVPLSADHAQVLRGLHVPGGALGSSGSPYFCLSDLAKRWPSTDAQARRIVVMITDGVDTFQRQFDPDDPYVQSAIADAVRGRLIVYAIYWKSQGRADQGEVETSAGQNLMNEVAQATGGKSFWQGMGNPVSFQPYFD
jgi:hypothetical protein